MASSAETIYYIIVASLTTEESAEREVIEKREKGNMAIGIIIYVNSPNYRIYADSSYSKSEAFLKLDSVRKRIPEAWILPVNTNLHYEIKNTPFNQLRQSSIADSISPNDSVPIVNQTSPLSPNGDGDILKKRWTHILLIIFFIVVLVLFIFILKCLLVNKNSLINPPFPPNDAPKRGGDESFGEKPESGVSVHIPEDNTSENGKFAKDAVLSPVNEENKNIAAEEEKLTEQTTESEIPITPPTHSGSSYTSGDNHHSAEELTDYEGEITQEETKYLQAQSAELERIAHETRIKKEKIKQDIQILAEATNAGNIELAEKKIETLTKALQDPIVDPEIANAILSKESDYQKKYTEGISDNLGIQYVDYSAPVQFVQGEYWKYAVAKFPLKGTIVFPHRRRAIARRGYMEEAFQSYLQNMLHGLLSVIGDCSILPAEDYRPYEPDIAIIDLNRPSIRIDIEIDEPYSAITNKPIHFVGCGDEFRDLNLTNLGWIVIRFTEHQICSDMQGCAAFIVQVIHAINPSLELPSSLLLRPLPKQVKRWSEIKAKVMASEKIREKYLNYTFGIKNPEQISYADIKQNALEKECAKQVKPIVFSREVPKISEMVEASPFLERDANIQFSPYEHIYLYKGSLRLIPVSSIVSYFFNAFDSDYWSNYKAVQRGVPQGQVLEEWDAKGAKSREVGTFMHQQIENHYKGLVFQKIYPFRYKGAYINAEEIVSLNIEYEQFVSFSENHSFIPFKTEWAIYDESLKIAGTIDMIHKRGDVFDIYDWKRSHRVLDAIGEPIKINTYGDKGIRGLNTISDTVYWHYCLQQNLYRYILEKNYGITVNKMYLVVFIDDAMDYTKLEVPRMDEAISIIVETCKEEEIASLLYE